MNRPDRSLVFAAAVLCVACATRPSDSLINKFVEERNNFQEDRGTSTRAPATSKVKGKEARARGLVGREFDAYIHSLRGEDGLARIEQIEVEVPDVEIGDKVRLKITGMSKSGLTVYGTVVGRLGSARVTPPVDGVSPGEKYTLEIVGITAAGDFYGLIGTIKTYVLGAEHVGERLTAAVLGMDNLADGEEVIYARKIRK